MTSTTASKLLIAITILLLATSANAQQSLKDTIKINEVIVTGSQVKVNKNHLPLAITVIDKTQIEESDESALLPILNGRVPGLFVTERGVTGFGVAQGSAGQISIRGIGGSPTTGVLMLIDGHPQFMGIMGHPLPDSYVASDVERVEVIRGPASVLYGSNAMGGVINIITKKQIQDGVHGNARVSYGSYNTQKYMGAIGYKKNKLNVFVSANHDQTDGHRANSAFNINNGYLKLAYNINEHFYASADFSMAAFSASDPGPDTINATHGSTIDITRGYGSMSFMNEFEKASGALKLFYNFGEHEITDGFHSTDNNFGFNFYESLQLIKGNTITIGTDFMQYGGFAENVKAMAGNGIVLADTSISEFGAYILAKQTIAEKFSINAGLRYQYNNIYGNQWIPSAGITFEINKTTHLKGNVSKGFRSPTIKELYMWGPQNADLQPESVINIETGITKSFMNKRITSELTVFAVNADNLITIAPVGGVMKFTNSGEINNKGIELALTAKASKNLNLNATYSYINMKNPVYATPESHLFISAHYKIKKTTFMASVQQVSNLDNNPTSVVNLQTYTLVNAKAMYGITKQLKVFVSGENLLGTSYQVNQYYTMPKATVFGGMSYKF